MFIESLIILFCCQEIITSLILFKENSCSGNFGGFVRTTHAPCLFVVDLSKSQLNLSFLSTLYALERITSTERRKELKHLMRNRRRFRCNPRYWNSHGSSCASIMVAVKVDGPNAVYKGTSLLGRWEERLQDIFNGRPYDMVDAALAY
ncbi:hypothetical protein Peur_041472 [Populus x canadensis]